MHFSSHKREVSVLFARCLLGLCRTVNVTRIIPVRDMSVDKPLVSALRVNGMPVFRGHEDEEEEEKNWEKRK